VFVAGSTNPVCSVQGTDASCGDANGSATVTAILGVSPYSYSWSNGATSKSISGLASGTYSVTVVDSKGCQTTCSVNIGDTVPPTCFASGTKTTCDENNGTATVFGIGGSGIYSYVWNTGQTTSTITNLSPGTYTVVVTDSNGCSSDCSVIINDSSAPRCSIAATDTHCGLSDGSATVSAIGGVPPYSYSWNNGSTSTTISGLAAGTYSVVITDFSGCQSMCSVTIKASSAPSCNISGTNTTCGLNNGSAVANVSGGSGNYTYQWSNGAATNSISNLSPGTYSVTVTDGSSCTTECSVFIQGSAPISCNVTGTNTSCNSNNGSATVNVSGGSGSYSYSWSNGSSSQSINGLSAGNYSVNVIDNNTGCTTSCSVTIQGSNVISCTISGSDPDCGLSDGSAIVTVNGGSGNYSYSWNTGANTQSISNLAAGNYVVNVVDNNTGCTTSCNITLQSSNPISCSISSTNATCGLNNGTATVTVFNGTGSYTYSWNNGAVTPTITGLVEGTYIVNVTDVNTGCSTSCLVVISSSPAISCSINKNNASCGLNNGSANVSVIGGSGNFSYA